MPDVTAPAALIQSGRAARLETHARTRLAEAPGDCGARHLLFAALAAQGRTSEARAELDQARLLQSLLILKEWGVDLARLQQDPRYGVEIGDPLYTADFVALASTAFKAALDAGAASDELAITYGLALQHQGRAEDAVEAFREAGRRLPWAGVCELMLPALFPAKDGLRRHAQEARRWADAFVRPEPRPPPRSKASTGSTLRIGYVAPSFAKGQLRQFIAPILDHHDPRAVEVFAYANQPEDAAYAAPVRMRSLGGLSDLDAAELVRRDGIDVLIDCWGHNVGNRLGMFAHRPAPVQISWLNYQQTTGMTAMDYVLHSDFAASDGMDALFTEKIWRMGDACAAFRPDPGPRTSPAPMLAKGHATFGAFIHPSKLTDQTVVLWAAILRAVPEARLILKYQYFMDPVLQDVTRARFLAEGAEPAQLEFRGRTSGAAYHAEFAEVDLALDPTPCVGGTTSLEALSRGVPVLTLRGETFYARLGASVVQPAGFDDLVAESPAAYVAKAVALARDPGAMQALHARAPAGFDAAPYRDEAGMARRLEAVYLAMAERWRGAAEAA